MRIISSFKDYYDTAMGLGIDPDCVYNRKTELLEIKSVKLPYVYKTKDSWNSEDKIIVSPFLIGFCGKIYKGIKVTLENNLNNSDYFYSTDSYVKYMALFNIEISNNKRWSWFGSGDHLDNERDVDAFFNRDFSNLEQLFQEHKTPVFAIYGKSINNSQLELNPFLKPYEFYKVIEPYQAFQDIFMYKAGVLGSKELDSTPVSDKIKIQSKGFDKFSFRTMKGDKKPRKKNRNKEKL